jgi:5-formyltetrahydrofolate cyclo-ligase
LEKREIRKEVNRLILGMDPEERGRRSGEVQERVVELPEFRDARCVAAYVALPFEVSTVRILGEVIARGGILALPRTNWDAHRMDMVRVEDIDRDLAPAAKGIVEPTGDVPVMPNEIDFVVVPGRAFDRSLNRVGQGGGFYDAFFEALRSDCGMCAVAFDLQVFDEVPTEEHDRKVSILVTETEVLRATSLP